MIGVVLVTHGRLAEELRAAALTIQPDMTRVVAVALEWDQTGEDARERIRKRYNILQEQFLGEAPATGATANN